jgi:ubiquinone/menaquinone biosynthesis C-methylase UbiE
MNTPDNISQLFDKYAEVYQEKYMDPGPSGPFLTAFAEALPPNARVLDIACGPGNTSLFLLKTRPDLQILGIDIAPRMVELARVNVPQASFQVMDVRGLVRLEPSFAGVICSFGLPYLSPEEATGMIRQIARLLSPGGRCYLSTMEGTTEQSGWQGPSDGGSDRLYMHYHEGKTLSKELEQAGLTVQSSERFPDPDVPGDIDLVLQAVK